MTSLLEDRREHRQQFLRIGSEVEELSQQLVRLQKLDKKIRIIANLDDSSLAVQFSGMGGVNPEEGIVEGLRREQEQRWAERIRQHLRGLRDLGDHQEASFRYLEQALEEKRDLLACTPSIWPTQGWLSCGFGHRQSPFTGLREFHRGVDVATRRGTPVMAPADGVVIETGKDAGFGLFLRLEHGFSYKTFYAHLHEIVVKKGQKVRRGQMIARVGNTGRSTGPHLHYEIHLSGLPVNPIRYILD
jgi:murein DD-endopeptidase MepM/ murein hydrolase activator NlpD